MTAQMLKAEEFGVTMVWYLSLSSPFVGVPLRCEMSVSDEVNL